MSDRTFSRLRVEYGDEPLRLEDLPADPIELLRAWLAAAGEAGVSEPNGMVLSTCATDGQPHGRVVLLKHLDARGLVFFTNKESAKGEQLAANPRAAATFWWPSPRARQVRIAGVVEHTSEAESEAYFRDRPRRAQLCSAASPQSRVVPDRDSLERLVDELTQRTGDGPVPRPPHWGGYRLVPHTFEFWQGRDGRLHDRFRVVRAADGAFHRERLAP